MPTNSLVSIRPDYELVTRYGAAWETQILNAASSAGLPTTDLYANNATATNFFSSLESQDPILVNLFGHGDYNLIAIPYMKEFDTKKENVEILLKKSCKNVEKK